MAKKDPLVELDEQYSETDGVVEGSQQAGGRRRVLALDSATGRTPARHADRRRLDGRRGVLRYRPGRAKVDEPCPQSARRRDNRINAFGKGLDIVVEGDAKPVSDEPTLARLADAFATKYDDVFGFKVSDGRFSHDACVADVYEVTPAKAFGYRRGKGGSATRFRF